MTNETQKQEKKYIKIPFIWSEYETFSGADFNLLYKNVEGDSKGANIAGFGNEINGDSKGANIAGIVNYSKGVKDFLFQYAVLGNVVKEENKDAFVMQLGLYNEIGDNCFPFIKIYGLKNIPKLIKKAFGKKSIDGKVEWELNPFKPLGDKLEGEQK